MPRSDADLIVRVVIRECDFQQAVVEYARLRGWLCAFTWRSIHSPFGEPDLRLCRPPRYILAELKTERGQPTGEQYEWLEAASRCPGVEVFLWRPSDWSEILEVLR